MAERGRWPIAAAVLVAAAVVVGVVLVLRGSAVTGSVPDHARYWEERATRDGEVAYVALGDSLTQAIGAEDPADGFVELLAEDLEDETGSTVRVVNLSVTGATVADVVSGQLPRLTQLREEAGDDPTLVTLAIGTNDAGITAPDAFRAELGVVLDELPDGALVADLPHLGAGGRSIEADELSGVVREEVEARPALVQVDLADATADQGRRDRSPDLFHPSARGYGPYHEAFAAARLDDGDGSP